ncbi:MAG: hypothetical protein Q9159_000273 [Coniocarpon cinnabarinum]
MERDLDGSIELKPLQPGVATSKKPSLPDILDLYDTLRDDEKHKKHRAKLEKAFAGADADDMKFSHSLQFNAVADWTNQYLAYSNLKKLIYTLESELSQRSQSLLNDAESTHLLDGAAGDPDKVFSKALDQELHKIENFYQLKEKEIFKDVDDLLQDEDALMAGAEALEASISSQAARRRSTSGAKLRKDSFFRQWSFPNRRRTSVSQHHPMMERIESEDSDEEPEEDQSLQRRATTGSAGRGTGSASMPRRRSGTLESESDAVMTDSTHLAATTKKRMVRVYVSLCELRSYLDLNKTGFNKALKKYDKTLDRKLKSKYMQEKIEQSKMFQPESSQKINDKINAVEQTYADIYTEGNVEKARRELGLDLREHVVWERNTVWREMIGIERKAQAAHVGTGQTILGKRDERSKTNRHPESKEFLTPAGRFSCPSFLLNPSVYSLVAAFAVFAVLMAVPILQLPEQQNCLAMTVFVSILWATEAIPLFVTSLLIPFMVVILRIVRTDAPPHIRLETKQAAGYIFSAMWTPVIMLLLGGFTIAAALSKYNIAKVLATFVLSKAGTRPRNVLLVNMFVSMFASMWISNVASPVLCFSIIQPILRTLPNDSDMIKALLLGIALSANIGGAASPIASPQNLIALQNMEPEPSWGVWFFIALPVCVITILLIWILLLVSFQPGRGTVIKPIRAVDEKFTGTQWFIVAVTLGTIALWCVSHQLERVFGDMGVIAIIPLVLFFGTGILTKEDFNNFLWTIIILAAGGLALGKAVSSSGLLQTIAEGITERIQGFSLYGVLVTFAVIILVIASFISHTVAALIFLPLVREVGSGLEEPRPNLLVMSGVLMCSAAMALPTSGFPNMTAIMMEDPQTGQRYLQVKHFISRGIPASVITFAVVVTVGYGLMRVVGLN